MTNATNENKAPAKPSALVVGNSDGIGLALSRRLLAEGWVVTGISRRPAPIDAPLYDHTVLDVSAAEYRAALHALLAGRGAFDVCVYCAGVGDLLDPADLSREGQVFRVNLLGAVDTIEAILPPMLAAGRGHFVGLSSIADDAVSPESPSYAASKAGLSSYLNGLALALRPRGVCITTVRLGFVDTKMAKSPVRPMMVSVERAVDVIMGCLRTRPAQLTFPKRMGALVRVLGWVAAIRVWLA